MDSPSFATHSARQSSNSVLFSSFEPDTDFTPLITNEQLCLQLAELCGAQQGPKQAHAGEEFRE